MQLVVEAKKVIDAINELRSKANLLNNVLAGKLNLGIIPTVSGFILPTEIFDFLKNHPKIELSVKEMTTDNIIKALKSGELDAGIISTPYTAANEFYHDFLFNEELMLYAADDSTSEKKDSFVVPEDIDVQKVWLLEEGNCLRTQFENICELKENTVKPKNLDFVASNINTLVQLVDKLGGISILPELAVEQLTDEQRQKVKRFRAPFPYREISVIYYKPTYKQKILDELIAFISESLNTKLNFNKNPEEFVGIKPQ